MEPLSNRALAIQEKALGRNHPQVAASLNMLTVLYLNKGDYEKAELLAKRALAIKEKTLGPEHSSLAYYFRNLARVYDGKGEYDKAMPLYLRALAIRRKHCGRNINWSLNLSTTSPISITTRAPMRMQNRCIDLS